MINDGAPRRRRVGTPGRENQETVQSFAAKLQAATVLAAGSATPVGAATGSSQNMAALSLGEPATLPVLHFCPVQGSGEGADLDGRQMDRTSGIMSTSQSSVGGLDEQSEDGGLQIMWTHGDQPLQQRHAPHISARGRQLTTYYPNWTSLRPAYASQRSDTPADSLHHLRAHSVDRMARVCEGFETQQHPR